VNEQPGEPAEKAREADAPEADHGAKPGDGRHAAQIAVTERLCLLPAQTALDRARGVQALLHRHLGHAGQLIQGHHVADHEHLRASRKGAIG
jgi:hypothetical protein